MKKLLIGFIIGATVMIGGQAFASSLVGLKIQGTFPVNLNGNNIGTAIVVNGSSYLPVRKVAESLTLQVKFANNTVDLSNVSNADKLQVFNSKKTLLQKQIDKTNNGISYFTKKIADTQAEIDSYKTKMSRADVQQLVSADKKQIIYYQQQLAKTQTELTSLQAEMTQINADIAATPTK